MQGNLDGFRRSRLTYTAATRGMTWKCLTFVQLSCSLVAQAIGVQMLCVRADTFHPLSSQPGRPNLRSLPPATCYRTQDGEGASDGLSLLAHALGGVVCQLGARLETFYVGGTAQLLGGCCSGHASS